MAPVSADAAVRYATNGDRCTIVGTSGADVLTGTSGKDVICGLGGNDKIRGGGGDDILDGGSGRDTVSGGDGNDRVYGGTGADAETGGSGRDVLLGGDGDDTLAGGGDSDTLRGQDGDDDLDGQSGSDNLDGGADTNWCTIAAADVELRCVYDRTGPGLDKPFAEPGIVDVTDDDKHFTLRMHVTDDTGVTWVNLSTDAGETGPARLVSGDKRDGWWEAEGTVRRYTRPGPWQISALAADRIGRQVFRGDGAFTVKDETPDVKAPVVTDLHMSRTKVDVRTGEAKVTVTMHIADGRAGVRYGAAALTSPLNDYNQAEAQAYLDRVSGTDNAGDYRAVLTIPRGAPDGMYNLELQVGDGVGNVRTYYATEMYAYREEDPSAALWPGGGGRLDVTGVVPDTTAPVLRDLEVDRTSVDTLPGPATLHFQVTASDVGGGIRQVTVMVGDPGANLQLQGQAYKVSTGTANNGLWRVNVTLPQGTPPGTYWVHDVALFDRNNGSFYPTPVSEEGSGMSALEPGHYRTTDGALWNGTITVIDNPAGG